MITTCKYHLKMTDMSSTSLPIYTRPEGVELDRATDSRRAEAHTSKTKKASFSLLYNDLPVGVLELNNGIWKFYYAEPFKQQSNIVSLVNFPDVNKVYESEDLWPFFVNRIPSTNRPSIMEVIDKEYIDARDLAALLSHFGKKTITNPFLLNPQLG
jgi:HipA-like protein